MASALDRFRGLKNSALSHPGNKEKLGNVGQGIVEFGGHAVLALATKNMPDGLFGIEPLKPDLAGLAVAGLGMLFGKGAFRRTAKSAAKGAGHALITRWVVQTNITMVHGPDGTTQFRAG
jgi:hypothetical protein